MKTSLMAAVFGLTLSAASPSGHAQTRSTCPAGLDDTVRCYNGADSNGAHYWIAIPRDWNQTLVLHAHGGPRLSPVTIESNEEDLQRFAVTVRQGFAWAGSTYRRPGYGVRMAAEDTENLRRLFIKAFGRPQHTILHGQSWGGNVAAKGIELYAKAPDGSVAYDGVVLTNGMIAGGTRNYLHRADLRAVYQYYCGNHPRPDEEQYPLWMGLPAGTKMTGKELEARVNECTGVKLPTAQRSARQQRNLTNILNVIRIPERTLVSHLGWATFMFRDLVQRVLEGRNPFSNRDAVYRGSDDDAALNKGVVRFDSEPQAIAQLAGDSDLLGTIAVPVITLHAIDDPTALVEYEAVYREVVAKAGNQQRLLQMFSDEHDHSKLADAEYAAIFDALMRWISSGSRPGAADVAAACVKREANFSGGCHFKLDFHPQPLFSRVAPRALSGETLP